MARVTIVPRWEWRTFGDRFGAADGRFRELSPTHVDDSDELYVLPGRGEASMEVSHGGLEQWRPVAKAEFPLRATDVARLLAALDVTVATLGRDAYELEQLVYEVVWPSVDLLAVEVHKRRAHYELGGCMAELTDVRAGSRATRTIAVEDKDPALVRSTVEELGLWPRPNVSFPRGLAALA